MTKNFFKAYVLDVRDYLLKHDYHREGWRVLRVAELREHDAELADKMQALGDAGAAVLAHIESRLGG